MFEYISVKSTKKEQNLVICHPAELQLFAFVKKDEINILRCLLEMPAVQIFSSKKSAYFLSIEARLEKLFSVF